MPIHIFSVTSTGCFNMSANEGTLNHNMEDNLVGITVKYIYVIRNTINDKVYVGQAVDPHKRFAGHLSEVRQNRDNSAIHGAMNKYGVEADFSASRPAALANKLCAGIFEKLADKLRYVLTFPPAI